MQYCAGLLPGAPPPPPSPASPTPIFRFVSIFFAAVSVFFAYQRREQKKNGSKTTKNQFFFVCLYCPVSLRFFFAGENHKTESSDNIQPTLCDEFFAPSPSRTRTKNTNKKNTSWPPLRWPEVQNGRQFASPRCREVSSATRAHSFQSFVPMVFMFILFFATWRSFSAHHSAPFGFSAFAYLFSFLFRRTAYRVFFSPIFASPRPTVLNFSIATFFFRFAASSSQPSLKRNPRIQTWFRLNFVGISFFCLHFFVVIQSNRLVRSRSTT